MRKLLLAIAFMAPIGAHAQYYYPNTIQGSFDRSYNMARGNGDIATIISQQRNTEAIINEMRAARGAPPCSIGLLGQWMGKPAC